MLFIDLCLQVVSGSWCKGCTSWEMSNLDLRKDDKNGQFDQSEQSEDKNIAGDSETTKISGRKNLNLSVHSELTNDDGGERGLASGAMTRCPLSSAENVCHETGLEQSQPLSAVDFHDRCLLSGKSLDGRSIGVAVVSAEETRAPQVGEVGYKFMKLFRGYGVFEGTVVQIAADKTRRINYTDGDVEDVTMSQLRRYKRVRLESTGAGYSQVADKSQMSKNSVPRRVAVLQQQQQQRIGEIGRHTRCGKGKPVIMSSATNICCETGLEHCPPLSALTCEDIHERRTLCGKSLDGSSVVVAVVSAEEIRAPQVGELGYKFMKHFPGYGAFEGTVVEVAADKKTLRVNYTDGDVEDVTMKQLRRYKRVRFESTGAGYSQMSKKFVSSQVAVLQQQQRIGEIGRHIHCGKVKPVIMSSAKNVCHETGLEQSQPLSPFTCEDVLERCTLCGKSLDKRIGVAVVSAEEIRAPQIGEIGYKFMKHFPGYGAFEGTVVQIAADKTRRIKYTDGDVEDVSMSQLRRYKRVRFELTGAGYSQEADDGRMSKKFVSSQVAVLQQQQRIGGIGRHQVTASVDRLDSTDQLDQRSLRAKYLRWKGKALANKGLLNDGCVPTVAKRSFPQDVLTDSYSSGRGGEIAVQHPEDLYMDDDIPEDEAAEATLTNVELAMRNSTGSNSPHPSAIPLECDPDVIETNTWLEQVACRLTGKRKPPLRNRIRASNKLSSMIDGKKFKDFVSGDVSLDSKKFILLSEISPGKRHNVKVFQICDPKRLVGEVIVDEKGWVEADFSGLMVKKRSKEFAVAPCWYSVGDFVVTRHDCPLNDGQSYAYSAANTTTPVAEISSATSRNSYVSLSHSYSRATCRVVEEVTECIIAKALEFFRDRPNDSLKNIKHWQVSSVEDAIIVEIEGAFPLGMKSRRFFPSYGFHDGVIVKVRRKSIVEKGISRPVLIYRVQYDDGDCEDFVHFEISSLRQIYNLRGVESVASPYSQLIPGTLYECQRGGIVKIKDHLTPPTILNVNEGGIVRVDRSKNDDKSFSVVDLNLTDLQLNVRRRVLDMSASVKRCNECALSCDSRSEVSRVHALENQNDSCCPSSFNVPAVMEWPRHAPVHNEDAASTNDTWSAQDAAGGGDVKGEWMLGRGLWLRTWAQDADAAGSKEGFPTHHLTESTFHLDHYMNDKPSVRQVVVKRTSSWDPASIGRYLEWDPFRQVSCEICRSGDDDHRLLICDSCHLGYHMYCVRPIIANVPPDDWCCPQCSGHDKCVTLPEVLKECCEDRESTCRFLKLPFVDVQAFWGQHDYEFGLVLAENHANLRQIVRGVLRSRSTALIGSLYVSTKFTKNDWLLPLPITDAALCLESICSLAAAMRFCGMSKYSDVLVYGKNGVSECMNEASLERIQPMSQRNLETFKAFKENCKNGFLPPLMVAYTKTIGFSVEALAPIAKFAIIAEYVGDVTTVEETGDTGSDSLMMLLNTDDPKTSLMIDPTRTGNISRFFSGVNNGCYWSKRNTNVRTRRFVMDGRCRVVMFASREIETGDTLYYDYNAGVEGKDVKEWARNGFYDTSNFY